MANDEFKIKSVVMQVLSDTDLLDTHEIAQEVASRLSPKQKNVALLQMLSMLATSVMSDSATSAVPSYGPGIKKTGKSWGKKMTWDHHRLNVGPGEWVFWPQFSAEHALAKIHLLNARIATTKTNINWYSLIASTLNAHGVAKIKDLPPEIRQYLEDQRHGIPPSDAE